MSSGGEPLPAAIQAALEKSLQVSLQAVRVHTDAHAHQLAERLSARAVTYGNHIFLGAGERATDLSLIGHEIAHVVQQQGAPTPQRLTSDHSDRYEQEAHQASAAVTRHESFTVQERTTRPRVQRLGISDALDYFADAANIIPGFRMFTIILGVNPINMSRVERSAANIMRALVEFLPGGGLITEALDNYGIFDRVGTWVEQQIRSLGMTGSLIKQALDEFLDSLSWSDIFDLDGVWERAKRIFTAPIDRIIDFATGLVTDIIKFIKDAILMPLAELAAGTPGWDLLIAVLGQNPITGEAVPRTADTLIGGFMKVIGQEEIWNNLQRANAVARAWAWFQGALSGLLGFVRQIPSLFLQALQALELMDIVLLPRAFVKVGRVFAGFLGQFFSWAGQQVLSLLQIIFEVVAPGAVPYIRRAAGAFRKIIENPIGFVGNLVRAGIQGFRQFAANFLTHLRASLISWLTGTLSGANIYIPQAFNLREIIKFVLSVLGLTWQNIRQKLVRAIGETAVRALETAFDIVVTLVRQGPAAAWEKIQEGISNLRQMVIEEIMTFVRNRVVQAAITRLLTSLNPAGAFIQAIIAIYNTIMFFIERLRQIAQVAMSFIDSIAAIANGVIAAAASRVERTMAGLLTLVISFLARIAGLGRVSDAVVNIVNRVRAPINRALDRVVEWIVNLARRAGRFLLGAARSAAASLVEWWRKRISFSDIKGRAHRLFFVGQGDGARLKVASVEMFTEDFIARVEAAMAQDPIARSLGTRDLALARAEKAKHDRATQNLQRAQRLRDPIQERQYEREQTRAIEAMVSPMRVLIDLLPENQTVTLPVRPGQFVTIPYKRTERKGEILVISNYRVRYKVDAVAAVLEMTTLDFQAKWGSEIFEYVEGSLRDRYLGDTPGKASATGRRVIARYENARPMKIRTVSGVVEVEWKSTTWHPLLDCDMSHHPEDAVDYWNRAGRHTGPKSSEVRAWMLDAANYILEPAAVNRSRGSANNSRYQPPTK